MVGCRVILDAMPLVFFAVVVPVQSARAFDPNYDAGDDPSAIRFVSADQSVCIRSDFPGGRVSQCVELGSEHFELLVRPERKPINDSAWYAFQIRSTRPLNVKIRLRYEGGTHRYTPQISHDGNQWNRAEHVVTAVHPAGHEAVLSLRVTQRPMWVSAHELMTNGKVDGWVESISQRNFVQQDVIGHSIEKRPIRRLKIGETDSPAIVFLMARQHPTEVSGVLGLMRFVEAITADTPAASLFRKLFTTVVVPNANPDGVAKGHWRCNAAGIDLNRDWARFTQPETKAIRDELLRYRRAGRRSLYLFLDFHATYEDVFYTAADVDEAFPRDFTSTWLTALDKRLDWYDVNHDLDHNENRNTSKAWVRDTLDVAAVTYEFGDETTRGDIQRLAIVGANEMMRLLSQRRTEHLQEKQLIRSSD